MESKKLKTESLAGFLGKKPLNEIFEDLREKEDRI